MIAKSHRLQNVQASLTLAISAKAKAMKAEGIDVVNFGVGEPDFPTPQPVVDAAIKALNDGKTKYTPVSGSDELRAGVAKWYERHFGVAATKNNVIISTGGKQVLYNALMSLCNAGDKVLIPSPYWLSYPAMVYLASAEPVYIDCKAENDFLMTADELEEVLSRENIKALILNSPSNPTGQAYDAESLEKLAAVIRKYPDLTVIWDNIYCQLTFGDFKHVELGKIAPDLVDRIIVAGGFSKSFSMTGWRLGFAIAHEDRIKAMSTIQSHSTSNPTTFAQSGALAALELDPKYLEEMRVSFERRAGLCREMVAKIDGVSLIDPKGAFYVFVDFSKYCDAYAGERHIACDLDLANYLIDEAHVATVPGVVFGAPGYLRLSFAISDDEIRRGLERIGEAVSKLRFG